MKFNVTPDEYGVIIKTKKSHKRFLTKMKEFGFCLDNEKNIKQDMKGILLNNIKKEKKDVMNYETPFDLAALLNEDFEINRYDEEIPNYRFSAEKEEIPNYRITKEEGDVHYLIDLNLGDKLVASFYEDGTWSIYDGIYSCAKGEIIEIFGFIYETDIKCWFKD